MTNSSAATIWSRSVGDPPWRSVTARLCAIARREAGLNIDPAQDDFLRARLMRRVEATGAGDLADYLRRLESGAEPDEIREMVEALTTHTTSFFRERRHFEWIKHEALPQFVREGKGVQRPLVLWSAACSTGAELWSAAITVETFRAESSQRLEWRAVGSDVSTAILQRAASASFSAAELAGLSAQQRDRFLVPPHECAETPMYQIAADLRRRTQLFRANLLEFGRRPGLRADIAFLRNVLIYFDLDGQRRAVEAVAHHLAPGGYLLTGHSESMVPVPLCLRPVDSCIWRKESA